MIDRAERLGLPEARPAIRNRGWSADGAATAVLDFGRRLGKRRLQLRLSGDNFRRRVAVEGGDDGAAWVTLVDEAWVFAVPGTEPARYETVDLPENDFPLLRVVAHPAPDENGRPAIDDAWVPGDGRPPRREERLVARWSEAQDPKARETWLTLDLGARHQPFRRGRARRQRTSASSARRASRPGTTRGPRGCGVVGGDRPRRALPAGARERRRECLRIEARGRERVLRVRVRNLDDRPLQLRGVALRVPVERLLFEAERPGLYRLTYGSPDRTTPSYDLARTAGDLAAWGDAAHAAALGPPRRLAAGQDEDRPVDGAPPVAPVGRPPRGRRGAGGADLRGAPPGRLRLSAAGRLSRSPRGEGTRCGRPAARTCTRRSSCAASLARRWPRGPRRTRSSAGPLSRHRARERGNERAVPDPAGGPKERGHDGAGADLDRLPQIVEGDPAVEGRERLVDRGARTERGGVPAASARRTQALEGPLQRRDGRRAAAGEGRRRPCHGLGGPSGMHELVHEPLQGDVSVRGRVGAGGEMRLGGRGQPLQQRPQRGRRQRRLLRPERVEDGHAQAGLLPLVEKPRRQRIESLDEPRGLQADERSRRVPAAGCGCGAGQDASPGPWPPAGRAARPRPPSRAGPPARRRPGRGRAGERGRRGRRSGRAPRGRPAGPPGSRWGAWRAGARRRGPRGESGPRRRSRAPPGPPRRAGPAGPVCARSGMVRSAR